MEIIIKPIEITRENFAAYGDLISADAIKPMDINAGYAKRFDDLTKINTSKDKGETIVSRSKKWKLLLNKVKLYAHRKHNFQNKLMKNKKVNYIRINIFPDGGISRIRAFGRVE